MEVLENPVITIDRITKIVPHNNADNLELAIMGKWPVCVQKNVFKEGEEVAYFQLDCLLPQPLAEKLGVWQYLHTQKRFLDREGFPMGRVVAAKLRGKPSYGFIVKKEAIPDGIMDLVSKWSPPEIFNNNDMEREHTLFHKFITIPNIRNYPDMFKDDYYFSATEKIHGMNARFGLVNGEFMCGSHNVRLRENANNKFWKCFTQNIKEMLIEVRDKYEAAVVILFGELYGAGIQDLTYNMKDKFDVRGFHIAVNGEYLHFLDVLLLCTKYSIPVVPQLHMEDIEATYTVEEFIEYYKNRKSELGGNIMEGIVFCSGSGSDFKIGKYVFDQYLTRKGGSEYK